MSPLITIRWTTADRSKMARIRARFGLPKTTTVNGLTHCEVRDEDMALFEQVSRLGYFTILPTNGDKMATQKKS